ncbi:hypothetical protein WJX72_001152 [[Myrmecia] bisecta]|uniref:Uncharacterized protein n=1 Tax=[Myrmecia] bisecta TaxID=41462 RepID=A0AAW1PCJ9_9CHLO
MAGYLHETLLDLYEAWQLGFAAADEVRKQRQALYHEAEERLGWVKCQLLPALAQEQGIYEAYMRDIKKPINHTVADYDRMADLEYALIVWRQNLRRDLQAANTQDEKVVLVRDAAWEGEQLIKRCVHNSYKFWSEQVEREKQRQKSEHHNRHGLAHQRTNSFGTPPSMMSPPRGIARMSPRNPLRRVSFSLPTSDAPLGGDGVITIYEKMVAKINLHIEEVAQQNGVADELSALAKEGLLGSPPSSPNKQRHGREE